MPFAADPLCGIVVDDFKKGSPIGIHILTHFHSDHYNGLRAKWDGGVIYCSEETARLASHCLRVPAQVFRHLPLGVSVDVLPGSVRATAVSANHCPGAVMVILDTPRGRVLHTGDFRLCDDLRSLFCTLRGSIQWLWLDNTYCDPKFNHPPQHDILKETVAIVQAALANSSRPVLVLVGTYTIGKERVALALHEAFGAKIECLAGKYAILQNVELFKCGAFIPYTEGPSSNLPPLRVILVPLGLVGYQSMTAAEKSGELVLNSSGFVRYTPQGNPIDIRKYSSVLCIRPTGWSRKISSKTLRSSSQESSVTTFHLIEVPYSEHCSFSEICETLNLVRPKHVVPFVDPKRFKEHRKILLAYEAPVQTTLDRFLFRTPKRERCTIEDVPSDGADRGASDADDDDDVVLVLDDSAEASGVTLNAKPSASERRENVVMGTVVPDERAVVRRNKDVIVIE